MASCSSSYSIQESWFETEHEPRILTRSVQWTAKYPLTATDFPHGDAFRQDQLAQGLIKRGDLSAPTIEKILSKNPARLYHF